MRPFKRVQDIDNTRDVLAARINTFLRSKGWAYTCDTPGSHWLWSLKYEGQIIMVDTNNALAIQRSLEDGR